MIQVEPESVLQVDRKSKQLRNRAIELVKVHYKDLVLSRGRDMEHEEVMRVEYPHLFAKFERLAEIV
jgi:hypothetical protein